MRRAGKWGVILIGMATLAGVSGTVAADDLLPDGVVLDLHYRTAHIDETGYAKPANADTLRATLGYLWKFAPNWSAYAEGTKVVSLFDGKYNSGANGETKYPSESDPPSTELSAAWIGYDNGTVDLRAGRQYVALDDQRFFTASLWRQNPQSFDAFSSALNFDTGTTLRYIYLGEVHRTVGNSYPDPTQREWSVEGNLFHIDQTLPVGTLTGYDYLVENDTTAKYSWRTAGARYTGTENFGVTTLNWTAEFAQQNSWRNNPVQYTADYHLFELNYGLPQISLKLGDELLGGNGKTAFSSPYGSNHGFDGWTNQFKNVPADGLEDRYAGGFGKITSALSWGLTFHNFFAQRNDQRYGSEANASLTYALNRNWSTEVDYANYHSNGFSVSQHELWLQLEYRHGTLGGA